MKIQSAADKDELPPSLASHGFLLSAHSCQFAQRWCGSAVPPPSETSYLLQLHSACSPRPPLVRPTWRMRLPGNHMYYLSLLVHLLFYCSSPNWKGSVVIQPESSQLCSLGFCCCSWWRWVIKFTFSKGLQHIDVTTARVHYYRVSSPWTLLLSTVYFCFWHKMSWCAFIIWQLINH